MPPPPEILLIRMLLRLFGGVVSYTGPSDGRPVVYMETPLGQLSWPITEDDVPKLGLVRVVPEYPWDGHTPDQRDTRLERLIRAMPNLTHANPRVRGAPKQHQ